MAKRGVRAGTFKVCARCKEQMPIDRISSLDCFCCDRSLNVCNNCKKVMDLIERRYKCHIRFTGKKSPGKELRYKTDVKIDVDEWLSSDDEN